MADAAGKKADANTDESIPTRITLSA
jgi:hypothetical protein